MHTQNYKYWRRKIEPYINTQGYVEPPSTSEIQQQEQEYKNLLHIKSERGSGWSSIGPFETRATQVGEPEVSWQANIYCIDQSVSSPNVLYCGTESGGIFKTTDKGLNWTWASLSQPYRTIDAIEIHPTNTDIVFAGDGKNIYRTIDGGTNWTTVYTLSGLGVNDISINHNDPNVILAATDAGLYKSVDGGANWLQVYNETCWDIEQKPGNADVVYLLKTNVAGKRCEFFRSIDRAATFTLQDTGWYFSVDVNRNDAGARMTVTPADTNRIYCVLIGNSKQGDMNYIGVYRSTDGGSRWSNPRGHDGAPYTTSDYCLATYQETSGFDQGYYNLSIAASNTDADVVLVGCLSLSKSTDGGAVFEYVGGYHGNTDWLHPDQQDIKINGNDMWLANDGGVAYSQDYFATLESRKNGIAASDFWGFGSGWNEDILVGGRYHNGNTGRNSNYPTGKYHRLGGAESPTGYVNPGNEKCYFSDICTNVLGEFYNEEAECAGNLSLYPNESYFDGESGDVEFHPYCYNTFYLGYENKIFRTTNGGASFDSLFAATNNTTRPVLQIEVSRSNPNVIYAYVMISSTVARLAKSDDGGQTWVVKNFPTGPNSMRAGAISLSGTDANKLWVCFGQQTNNNGKVYVTYDGGDNWTNLTTNTLNNHYAVNLVHQLGTNSLVYLATDKAVFYRDSTMNDWQLFNAGLPVSAGSLLLKPFYKDSKLRLATYGNGIWETALVQNSLPLAQPTVDKLQSFCPRDTFYFESYSVLNHTNATWLWNFSPAPLYVSSLTVRNPKVVFGNIGAYTATLTVTDGNGSTSTKTVSNLVTVFPSQCSADTVPGFAVRTFPPGSFVQTADMNMGSTNHLTLSAWIKANGIQNDYAGIVFTDNNNACGLNFKSNNKLGYHWGGSGSWSWNGGPTLDTAIWNHVALVVTPDSVTIYLNGVGNTRVAAHDPVDFKSFFRIGRDRGYDTRTVNGLIDEVCIYKRSLSRDEIRELRHLTRKPLTDTSLVAYYQFNEMSGEILDRAGNHHASLVDSALRQISSAPVGGGVSERIAVLTGSPYYFSTPATALDFSGVSESPLGEVVISRLNILPYATPDTSTAPEHSYYIINNYGLNTSALHLDSIVMKELRLGTQYENHPEVFMLYTRTENSDSNFYTANIQPTSATSANNFELNFSTVSTQINPLGQMLIVREFVSSLDNTAYQPVKFFPNPTSIQSELHLHTALKDYTFRVADVSGRLVFSKKCSGSQKFNNIFTAAGFYSATITDGEKQWVRKLVVSE